MLSWIRWNTENLAVGGDPSIIPSSLDGRRPTSMHVADYIARGIVRREFRGITISFASTIGVSRIRFPLNPIFSPSVISTRYRPNIALAFVRMITRNVNNG